MNLKKAVKPFQKKKKQAPCKVFRLSIKSDSRIIRNAVMRDKDSFHYIFRTPLNKSDRLAVKPNSPHLHLRQSRKVPDFQTADGVVVSDACQSPHRGAWRFHSVHLAENAASLLSLGRLRSELVSYLPGRQQDLPQYLKGQE